MSNFDEETFKALIERGYTKSDAEMFSRVLIEGGYTKSEVVEGGIQFSPVGPYADDEGRDKLYSAIGRFICLFSRLESTIRFRLKATINIFGEAFDAIVTPYDFAMLCTVSEKVMNRSLDAEAQKRVKKVFDRCRSLNQLRVIIAHGTWTFAGARHVSRQKLEEQWHFKFLQEIEQAGDTAEELTLQICDLPPSWLLKSQLRTQPDPDPQLGVHTKGRGERDS